ncbi:hypothetical protein ABT255_02395 [Streptomyces mirabilis]|uniref:hypothetical protein n=1 Tax=Streptomyces mirabilis TaxID=68239 RepID=UPI0033315484
MLFPPRWECHRGTWNVTDIAPNQATITLTVNPPGRTEATEQTFALPPSAQVAPRQWLPIRRRVITDHAPSAPRRRHLNGQRVVNALTTRL